FGERGVFGQEAITGVDGFGIRHLGRRNDRRHVQVALGRRSRPDAHGLFGQLDVFRVAVGLGIDHDRLHSEFAAGTLDAQRDLSAIGDKNLLEHQATTNSGCPYSTAWPFSQRIWVMVPALSVSISLRIFMASMMQTVSPSLTWLPISTNGFAPGLAER